MKKILYIITFLLAHFNMFGQGKILTSQYYQNLPAYSPAFTGANDYWDIRTGLRSQWTGFEGAPKLGYISGYGVIRRNFDGNESGVRSQKFFPGEGTKLGVGGYVLSDDQGPLTHMEGMANFAVHIRFSGNKYLSLGTSAGITNSKVDVSELTARDAENDITFQNYINNAGSTTNFNLNASLGFYSKKFYVSYGMMQLTNQKISGDAMFVSNARVRNNVLAGVVSQITPKIELLTNIFYRFEKNIPASFDLGVRARYNENLTFGFAYRNDNTLVTMLGISINDLVRLGYSYDYKTSDFNNFNNSSHEIVIGVMLFRQSQESTIW